MPIKPERIAVLQAVLDCSEPIASRLDRLAIWTTARRSQVLLHQGDEQRHCYIVVSGSADLRVVGREGQYIQIATVEPGEIFGAYPAPRQARADVRAQNAMELVSLDAAQLSSAALVDPGIGAGLARILAGQLGNVLDRFAARVTLTAVGRVYAHLLDLVGPDGDIGKIPAVAALAVHAQTTRETASRAISALERRGVLERTADRWLITSPRLLEELVI
jgi:CRP/FNR family transcriptional regulator, cyclic AMP receptor protein